MFWLLQFVSKLIHTHIRDNATFLLLQFVPNLFSRRILSKINVLATQFVSKLIHTHIRDNATFLLLQFVPKLLSRGNMSKIKFLAPTVCFKNDSFTRSGRMPLFCSYSLDQSCLVEVI